MGKSPSPDDPGTAYDPTAAWQKQREASQQCDALMREAMGHINHAVRLALQARDQVEPFRGELDRHTCCNLLLRALDYVWYDARGTINAVMQRAVNAMPQAVGEAPQHTPTTYI